jgi:hypothetical protein
MSKIIPFTVHLAVSSYEEKADQPTAQDLAAIAQNIEFAVEHFRATEGLSDANSKIYVEYVERVSPLGA